MPVRTTLPLFWRRRTLAGVGTAVKAISTRAYYSRIGTPSSLVPVPALSLGQYCFIHAAYCQQLGNPLCLLLWHRVIGTDPDRTLSGFLPLTPPQTRGYPSTRSLELLPVPLPTLVGMGQTCLRPTAITPTSPPDWLDVLQDTSSIQISFSTSSHEIFCEGAFSCRYQSIFGPSSPGLT